MKNKDRNKTDSKNKKADYYLIQHAQGARDMVLGLLKMF